MHTVLFVTLQKSLKILALIIFVLLTLILGFKYSQAIVSQTLSGYGWGGGVSSNPTGYDGMGWIDFSGVEVPVSNGTLYGYAWSEYYGWISFNASDVSGCSPTLGAASRSGNSLTGGARILAIKDAVTANNAGGYDGCIDLSDITITNSGSTYYLSGYAWSSDLGWIDVSDVTFEIDAPTATLEAKNLTADSSWSGSSISLQVGDELSLRWNSTNSVSCSGGNFTITGNTTSGTTTDVTEPALGETIIYTLACLGANSNTVYDTITTIGTGTPPTITNCSGREIVRSGDSVNICWDMGSAASCNVTGPNLNLTLDGSSTSGTETVTILNESTYTIDCGMGGSEEVTVSILPTIEET